MAKELDPITGLEKEPVKNNTSNSPLVGKKSVNSTVDDSVNKPDKSNKSNSNRKSNSPLVGKKSIDNTGYFDESGFEATGIGKSLQTNYGSYLSDGFDLRYRDGQEDAAQNQSSASKIGHGLGRAVGKAAVEVLKIPGYVGGALFSGAMEGNFLENLSDNDWINAMDSLDEGIKEFMPVHVLESVKNGNAWDKFTSAGWWGTDFADGLGYMAGMLGPGAIVKGIGLGAGAIRVAGGASKMFGRTGKLKGLFNIGKAINPKVIPNMMKEGVKKGFAATGNAITKESIDLGAATILSTTFEAAAESKGIRDRLKVDLLPLLENKEITQEEYDRRVNQGAHDVFMGNLGILVVPNLIANRIFLGSFAGKGKIPAAMMGGTDDVAKATAKGFLGKTGAGISKGANVAYKYGKPAALGVGREGFFEEGMQSTLEEYVHDKNMSGEDWSWGDFGADLKESYTKMLFSSEGQSAILAGSLLGGGMSAIQGAREVKANTRLDALVNETLAGFADTYNSNINDVYKKKEDGSLELDSDGRPIIDLEKFENTTEKISKQIEYSQALAKAAKSKDALEYERVLNTIMNGMVQSFVTIPNGRELLKEKLEGYQEFAALKLQGEQLGNKNITSQEYVDKFLHKFDAINNAYNHHVDMIIPQTSGFVREMGGTKENLEEFQSKVTKIYVNAILETERKHNVIASLDAEMQKDSAAIDKYNQLNDLKEGDEGYKNPKESKNYKALTALRENYIKGVKDATGPMSWGTNNHMEHKDRFSTIDGLRKEYKEFISDKEGLAKKQDAFETAKDVIKESSDSGVNPDIAIVQKVSSTASNVEKVLDSIEARANENGTMTPELQEAIDQKRKEVIEAAKLARDNEELPESEQKKSTSNRITREKNEKSLKRKISSVKDEKSSTDAEIQTLKETLSFLKNFLEEGITADTKDIDYLENQIANLEATVKSKGKQNTKAGKTSLKMIEDFKKEIKSSFTSLNSIKDRIIRLEEELNTLEEISKDLDNKIQYYNSLILDGNLTRLDRVDIQNKLDKVKTKRKLILKLIDGVRNAIAKSTEILLELLKIVNSRIKVLDAFSKTTGFKKLSTDELAIRLKDKSINTRILKSDNYAALSKEVTELENSVNEALDATEFQEEVQATEQTRLERLFKTQEKLERQIRYLEELLVNVKKDVKTKKVVTNVVNNEIATEQAEQAENNQQTPENVPSDISTMSEEELSKAFPGMTSQKPVVNEEALNQMKSVDKDSIEEPIESSSEGTVVTDEQLAQSIPGLFGKTEVPQKEATPNIEQDSKSAVVTRVHNADKVVFKVIGNNLVFSYSGDLLKGEKKDLRTIIPISEVEKNNKKTKGGKIIYTNNGVNYILPNVKDLKALSGINTYTLLVDENYNNINSPLKEDLNYEFHKVNQEYLQKATINTGDEIEFIINPDHKYNKTANAGDVSILLTHNDRVVGVLPTTSSYSEIRKTIWNEYQGHKSQKEFKSSHSIKANKVSGVFNNTNILSSPHTIVEKSNTEKVILGVAVNGVLETPRLGSVNQSDISYSNLKDGRVYLLVKNKENKYIPYELHRKNVSDLPDVVDKLTDILNSFKESAQSKEIRDAILDMIPDSNELGIANLQVDSKSGNFFIGKTADRESFNGNARETAEHIYNLTKDKFANVNKNSINKPDYNKYLSKNEVVTGYLSAVEHFTNLGLDIDLNTFSEKRVTPKAESTVKNDTGVKPSEKSTVSKADVKVDTQTSPFYDTIEESQIATGQTNEVVVGEYTFIRTGKDEWSSSDDVGKFTKTNEEILALTKNVKANAKTTTKESTKQGVKKPKLRPRPTQGFGIELDDLGPARKSKERNTTRTKADIAAEIKWFKKNFPGVDIKVLDDLRSVTENGVEAWGVFKNAIAYIHRNAPEGTTYHESFHAVYRLMISPEQRANLHNEATTKFTFEMAKFDLLQKEHPKLNEEQLMNLYYEEELADAFQTYQIQIDKETGELKKNSYLKYLGSKILDFFRRLFNVGKVFSNKSQMLSIDEVFEKMSKGGFKKASITRSVNSVTPVYSAIRDLDLSDTEVTQITDYINNTVIKHVKSIANDRTDSEEIRQILSERLFPENTQDSLYADVYRKLIAKASYLEDSEFSEEVAQSDFFYKVADAMFTTKEDEEGFDEISNFKEYIYDLMMGLSKFGHNPKVPTEIQDLYNGLETRETLENEEEILENWQQAAFKVAPDVNLSAELKLLFATIPTGQFNEQGIPLYYDSDYVFNTLLANFTNSTSVSEMISFLNDMKDNHEFVKDLLTEIEISPKLKEHLFTIAQKVQLNSKLLWVKTEKVDVNGRTETFKSYFLMDSNNNTLKKVIEQDLHSALIQSKLINKEGAIVEPGMITDQIKNLDEVLRYLKINDSKLDIVNSVKLKEVINILKNSGILHSTEIVNKLTNPKELSSFLKVAKSVMVIIERGQNPFDGTHNEVINNYSKTLKPFAKNYHQGSYQNINGETVQTTVNGFFASKQLINYSAMNKVDNAAKFAHKQEVFKKRRESSAIMGKIPMLQEDSEFMHNHDLLEFAIVGGIRQDSQREGLGFTKFGDKGFVEFMMNSYISGNSKNFGWYSAGILSDAPNNLLVKMEKKGLEAVVEDLFYVAQSEFDRIQATRDKIEKANEYDKLEKEAIENGTLDKFKKLNLSRPILINNRDYGKKNGLKFQFFPTLTEEDFNTNLTVSEIKTNVKNKIRTYLDIKSKELETRMKELKIEDNLDEHKNFFYNDFLAKINIILLTSNDPALYKNGVDFFKRHKQILSPGIYGNSSATFNYTGDSKYTNQNGNNSIDIKSHYKTLFLQDNEISAIYAEGLYDAFISTGMNVLKAEQLAASHGYIKGDLIDGKYFISQTDKKTKVYVTKANETDAQAYITLERWRDIQIMHGRYNNRMHDDVVKAQNLRRSNLVTQPIKPFVATEIDIKDKDGNLVETIMTQNKNSEYVLLPELAFATKDNSVRRPEGDKPNFSQYKSPKLAMLLHLMEKKEVDSVQFDSAIKVGLHNTKDSSVESLAELTNTTNELQEYQDFIMINNNDYRIQMETPEHFIAADSLIGTQIRKLVMADLVEGADYNNKSASEVKAQINEIFKLTLDEFYMEAFEEFKSPETLNKLLKNEIVDRDLGEQYINAIELDPTTLKPKVPYHHPMLENISQNMFNAILKNKLAKTKVKGGSLYNLASYGHTNDLNINFTKEGGIESVEAMVPAEALFGNEIPSQFYSVNSKGDSFLDISKIQKDKKYKKLLEGIVYRIPTEDKYSMFNIKVVGFLPKNAAIMLPTGADRIAGLDFDIDKVFGMFYNLDESGVVESGLGSKESRDNKLLDLYKDIKSSPASLESTMTPGGYDVFKDIVKEIGVLKQIATKNSKGEIEFNESDSNVASFIANLDAYSRNMAGMAGIGIFANHLSSHAILQEGDINLKAGILNFDKKYNTSLSDIKDIEGNVITRSFAELVAASADNAKDPLSGYANINTYTSDILALFLHNGRSMKTALAFLNQDIIVDFVNQYYIEGNNKQASNKVMGSFGLINSDIKIQNFQEYDTENLLSRITGNTKKNYTVNDELILKDFLKLKKVSSEMSRLVNVVKSGDSGVGPTMGDNEQKIRNWDDVKEGLNNISGHAKLMSDENQMFVNYFETAVRKANNLINDNADYPYGSELYKTVKDLLSIDIKLVQDRTPSVKELNRINSIINTYLVSDNEMLNHEELENIKNVLPGILSKLKTTEFREKYANLVNHLHVKYDTNTNESYISFSTVGTTKTQQSLASKSWQNMLLRGNEADKQFALNLFKYNFATSGLSFTRDSFLHIAPVEVYSYIEGLDVNNMKDDLDKSQATDVFEQYILNEYNKLAFVPLIKPFTKDKSINVIDSIKEGKVKIPTRLIVTEKSTLASFVDGVGMVLPGYIKSKTNLFKLYDYRTGEYRTVVTPSFTKYSKSFKGIEYLTKETKESIELNKLSNESELKKELDSQPVLTHKEYIVEFRNKKNANPSVKIITAPEWNGMTDFEKKVKIEELKKC